MKQLSTQQIGTQVRTTRKARKITQRQLALASGTGLRFISELEHGKPSCEMQKVLRILHTLGIELILKPPVVDND